MKINNQKEAKARFGEICLRKQELLVESAKRKIESGKLTVEAAAITEKFQKIDIGSMPRCW